MKTKLGALVAGGALVLSVACAQTDAGVTTSVKSKLAADDTVKAYQIDVDTQNHVVTLKGDVETAAAKERAIEIARTTDGVTDVIDQLSVRESAATSGDIDVDDRARAAGERAGEKIEDYSRRTADKAEDLGEKTVDKSKELGRDAADATKDAARKTGAAVTDASLTAAVKSKFLADSQVKGLNIDVDTSNGVVTLNGHVSSQAEANRAMTIARNTDGVKRVINNLKVG